MNQAVEEKGAWRLYIIIYVFVCFDRSIDDQCVRVSLRLALHSRRRQFAALRAPLPCRSDRWRAIYTYVCFLFDDKSSRPLFHCLSHRVGLLRPIRGDVYIYISAACLGSIIAAQMYVELRIQLRFSIECLYLYGKMSV